MDILQSSVITKTFEQKKMSIIQLLQQVKKNN
jgi:hypothetical protein